MKAFYIPTALLALMLLAAQLAGSYVEQNTTQWIDQLHGAITCMDEDRWEDAQRQIHTAWEDWLRHSETFHMFLKHEELDEMGALFVNAIAACTERDRTELRIHLQQLILRLESLSRTQKATWANIL